MTSLSIVSHVQYSPLVRVVKVPLRLVRVVQASGECDTFNENNMTFDLVKLHLIKGGPFVVRVERLVQVVILHAEELT